MKIKLKIKKLISNPLFPLYRIKEEFINKGRVRVLAYHSIGNHVNTDVLGLRINQDDFRNQMQSLKDWNYEVIDMDTLFRELPFFKKSEKSYIILTFDDGYKDFVTHVLPILKEYGYPVTLFVNIEYLEGIRPKKISGYWENWEKMSWSDLKAIKTNSQVKIGSHGYSHKRLNRLSNEELIKEIKFSKTILENELGERIDFFAYPHGVYNEACLVALKESGYKAAFTGKPGLFDSLSNIYEIKRTEISYYHSSRLEFRKKINGSYDWIAFKDIFIKQNNQW